MIRWCLHDSKRTGLAVITLGGMGAAKIFGNFSGALMLVPTIFAMIAWFKFVYCHDMIKEEQQEREADDELHTIFACGALPQQFATAAD